MKELMIDYSVENAHYLGGDSGIFPTEPKSIKAFISLIEEAYQISLKMMPYSRITSPFMGGRFIDEYNPSESNTTDQERIVSFSQYHKYNIPFNLVLNSVFYPKEEVSFSDMKEIYLFLEQLNQSNKEKKLGNAVTLGNKGLLGFIEKEYPYIKIISSCIKEFDVRKDNSLSERLQDERYNFVVPINQHTTHKYLSNFSEYVNKMILLLSLECGERNMNKCYKHYLKMESKYYSLLNLTQDGDIPNDNFSLKSQLPNKADGCPQRISNKNAALINREKDDLIPLISMGIKKFKVPLNFPLSLKAWNNFLNLFKKYSPQ